jgi:hypothetical protein
MGKANLESLKLKVASQVGVTLNQGYNGDITTRQAGLIGGNMVRELIAKAEQNLSRNYHDNTSAATGYFTPAPDIHTTNNPFVS